MPLECISFGFRMINSCITVQRFIFLRYVPLVLLYCRQIFKVKEYLMNPMCL